MLRAGETMREETKESEPQCATRGRMATRARMTKRRSKTTPGLGTMHTFQVKHNRIPIRLQPSFSCKRTEEFVNIGDIVDLCLKETVQRKGQQVNFYYLSD